MLLTGVAERLELATGGCPPFLSKKGFPRVVGASSGGGGYIPLGQMIQEAM